MVIATGYYDTPRPLGVPGADLPKVSHYFREPFPFFDQDVVVIGGGNSAADAALTIWREGARVTLVHLFDELDTGVKPWVRPDVEGRIRDGTIATRFGSRVAEVLSHETGLEFVEAEDHFEANSQRDGLVECHGQLRTIAVTLFNVTNTAVIFNN